MHTNLRELWRRAHEAAAVAIERAAADGIDVSDLRDRLAVERKQVDALLALLA